MTKPKAKQEQLTTLTVTATLLAHVIGGAPLLHRGGGTGRKDK